MTDNEVENNIRNLIGLYNVAALDLSRKKGDKKPQLYTKRDGTQGIRYVNAVDGEYNLGRLGGLVDELTATELADMVDEGNLLVDPIERLKRITKATKSIEDRIALKMGEIMVKASGQTFEGETTPEKRDLKRRKAYREIGKRQLDASLGRSEE